MSWHPTNFASTALEWPLLLHLERALLAATLIAALGIFALRGWEGDFPRKVSTSGAEWADASTSVIASLSAEVTKVDRQIEKVVAEIRERLPLTAGPNAADIDNQLSRLGEAANEADKSARRLEAISRLPEREKLIIALRDFEGLTQREIAEILGITQGRVSQLETRARNRLDDLTR